MNNQDKAAAISVSLRLIHNDRLLLASQVLKFENGRNYDHDYAKRLIASIIAEAKNIEKLLDAGHRETLSRNFQELLPELLDN